jgi:cob(I)alamin adenosyltransferase
VAKSHPRIAAYGTVDETNAAVGLARATLVGIAGVERADAVLGRVQAELFVLGGDLSAPHETTYPVPRVAPAHVAALERDIDAFTADLPPLKHFILPGGHPAAAALHLARTVCRRAERLVVELAAMEVEDPASGEGALEPLHYLNRLSDLLFTMARWVNHQTGTGDVEWVPVERKKG